MKDFSRNYGARVRCERGIGIENRWSIGVIEHEKDNNSDEANLDWCLTLYCSLFSLHRR